MQGLLLKAQKDMSTLKLSDLVESSWKYKNTTGEHANQLSFLRMSATAMKIRRKSGDPGSWLAGRGTCILFDTKRGETPDC